MKKPNSLETLEDHIWGQDTRLAKKKIISSTKGFHNPSWDMLCSIKRFKEPRLRPTSCIDEFNQIKNKEKEKLFSLLIIKNCFLIKEYKDYK